MRVVTVTPPYFLISGPTSAASVLTAVLRRRGHEAINFDVNRFCIDDLLSRPALERSIKRALPKIDSPIERAEVQKYLAPKIGESTSGLFTGSAFASLGGYRRAQRDVERALWVHALAHGRSRWSSVEFVGNHDRANPHELIAAAQTGGELFDGPLDIAAEQIAAFEPDLVAISVSVPYQLYGTLRLASRLREVAPNVHVCLGGPTITKLRGALAQLPALFQLVDSVILREGEASVLLLAECLQQGRDPLELVPELVAQRSGSVVMSTPGALLRPADAFFDFREMPPPVFDDLVPGRYLSPTPLLPVSTTRNCYYDKCDFCSISRSFARGYREMSPRQMIEQMATLTLKHGAPLFKDVSEALPPRLLFDLCDQLDRRPERFLWEAYLRFESPFNNRDAARRLHRAGLRVAYLGLETASQRLSDEMAKNIDVKAAEQTIRHFAEEGIWVHLFLMAGHPNETESDHEATLQFIRRNVSYIHSIQAAGFQMELDSNIVRLGDRFGFRVRPRQEPTFSLTFEFEERGTLPPQETISRRVSEFGAAACENAATTLARSRHVWDGHKIFFVDRQGRPELPPESVHFSFAPSFPKET